MTDTRDQEAASIILGNAKISTRLWQEAEQECRVLRDAVKQRDYALATIITNLKKGAAVAAVLAWYEDEWKPRRTDVDDILKDWEFDD